MNPGDLIRWLFSEYVPCDGDVKFDYQKHGIIIEIEIDDGISLLRKDGKMVKNEKRANVMWQDGSLSWIPCIELIVISDCD